MIVELAVLGGASLFFFFSGFALKKKQDEKEMLALADKMKERSSSFFDAESALLAERTLFYKEKMEAREEIRKTREEIREVISREASKEAEVLFAKRSKELETKSKELKDKIHKEMKGLAVETPVSKKEKSIDKTLSRTLHYHITTSDTKVQALESLQETIRTAIEGFVSQEKDCKIHSLDLKIVRVMAYSNGKESAIDQTTIGDCFSLDEILSIAEKTVAAWLNKLKPEDGPHNGWFSIASKVTLVPTEKEIEFKRVVFECPCCKEDGKETLRGDI